jgi:hypothetical protein
MKFILLKSFSILLWLYCMTANGQAGIGIGPIVPNSATMLEVRSTTKGLLIPRMTFAEINQIINPANGLQVFSTTDNRIYFFSEPEHRWRNLIYGTGVLALPATFSLGSGSSCAYNSVSGTYIVSDSLVLLNKVTVQVEVTGTGSWTAFTDSLNGYSFAGSGVFTETGTQTITLQGSGAPVAAQTDLFTTSAAGAGSCTFSVTVIQSPALKVKKL